MLSLVARGDEGVLNFPLPRGDVRLGRDRENQLHVPFRGVSRRHALVSRTDDCVRLVDLESKNGLIVDGVRVRTCILEPGKRVKLGVAEVWLEESATADGTRPAFVAANDHDNTLSLDGVPDDGLRFFARLAREGIVQPQSVLAEARRFLRASALRLLRADARGSMLASAGAAVAADVVRYVAGHAAADQHASIWYSGSAAVLFSVAGGRILVATFDGPPRTFTARERDFITCLAERLRPAAEPCRHPPAKKPPVARTAFVGESAAARRIREEVASLAECPDPILLLGETGTGKDVLANLLHETGPYRAGRFVPQNCAAFPEQLIASQLFGTLSGVATGVTASEGFFVAADGGTLFLDEVGDLKADLQNKLLRVVEDREVWPVGARSPRRVSLRLVLATQSDEKLRRDLFHRCEPLFVPPLRDRRDDVERLALHFLAMRASLTQQALDLLVRYDWPGNVRELKRVVERAVRIYGRGAVLHEDHIHAVLASLNPGGSLPAAPLHAHRDAETRRRIAEALHATDGNKSEAARRIGMSRNGLAKAMLRLGV